MDATHEWLLAQVRENSRPNKSASVDSLARAVEAMTTLSGQAFGMVFRLPESDDLATIRTEAIRALAAWVEIIDGDLLTKIERRIAPLGVIDFAARRARIAEKAAALERANDSALMEEEARDFAWRAALARQADPQAPPLEDSVEVYADYLQQRGDPRGELMALQHAASTNSALQPTVTAFIRDHWAALLGPLAEFHPQVVRWKLGLLDHVTIASANAKAALGMLLTKSIGQSVRSLCIPADPALVTLIREFPPHYVRELTIGPESFAVPRTIGTQRVGDLSRLVEALPDLRSLVVEGSQIEFARRPESDSLERLVLRTAGLPYDALGGVVAMRTPKLKELEVWFGRRLDNNPPAWNRIAALIARRDLPELRTLGLRNAEFSLAIAQTIVEAPLLRQLKVLDLSLGVLSSSDAYYLVRSRDRLRHLARLDISHNYVSPARVAEIRTAVADVRADGQIHFSPADDTRAPYTART
ncbi:MAG: hypothetical protein QM831_06000 [Kofleriaceae bacterium]